MLAIVQALASRAAAIMWLSVLLRKSVRIRLVQFLPAIVVHAFEIVFRHVQMIQMARLMLVVIALLRVTWVIGRDADVVAEGLALTTGQVAALLLLGSRFNVQRFTFVRRGRSRIFRVLLRVVFLLF